MDLALELERRLPPLKGVESAITSRLDLRQISRSPALCLQEDVIFWMN
jgi:hypothetical protein